MERETGMKKVCGLAFYGMRGVMECKRLGVKDNEVVDR
jgi:hypothetical protein